MSKVEGRLSYKDWCILKHALEKEIKLEEKVLFLDTLVTANNLGIVQRDIMKKEMEEEKKTLERVTELTSKFKNYIKGGRHY